MPQFSSVQAALDCRHFCCPCLSQISEFRCTVRAPSSCSAAVTPAQWRQVLGDVKAVLQKLTITCKVSSERQIGWTCSSETGGSNGAAAGIGWAWLKFSGIKLEAAEMSSHCGSN